ncbi:MAG TPA: hypothetical protein VFW53_00535 [Gallionella sp.]|nr:hypothetical protein [Gallionella sp.]
MLNRRIVFITLGCTACIALSSPSLGSELTPYRLPSEKMSYPQNQDNPPSQPTSQMKSINVQDREEYYITFRSKTENLSENEKQSLEKKFHVKEKAASGQGNYEEAQHYHRLQEILNGSKSK